MITLIQKQRELFDKKFDFRIEKEKGGIFRTILYHNQGTTAEGRCILKSFLTTCLIEHYEEDIRELEGKKDNKLYGFPFIISEKVNLTVYEKKMFLDGFNSALDLAISLLQDKIKELKK